MIHRGIFGNRCESGEALAYFFLAAFLAAFLVAFLATFLVAFFATFFLAGALATAFLLTV